MKGGKFHFPLASVNPRLSDSTMNQFWRSVMVCEIGKVRLGNALFSIDLHSDCMNLTHLDLKHLSALLGAFFHSDL